MKHFLSCACSLLLFGFAQAALAEAGSAPGATTTLDQKGKTVLMADDATGAAQLQGFNPAPKRIWMSGWQKSSQTLSWKVKAPAEADYEVELISSGIPAVRLEGGSAPLEAKLAPQGWQRQTLGRIHLKNGDNTLTLSLPQDLPSGGQLRSLDLLPVAARADYDQRVKASRSSAAWMRGHYGVFLQYGAWGWPEHGDKKPWEEVVKAFDVEKFAKMVDEDMGAKWVIWSITWRGSIFPMPLKSVDAIVPGHTTQRDLPADLIAALKKRGIKLMFYYHPGSEDPTWWAANWKDGHDKEKFISNWQAVMTEIGSRYGEDLAGWFFDDGCVYSPAPFEAMTRTAKTGFPGRLVSYNNWVLPSYTDFEDIQMGEGFTGSKATALGSDGVYKDGQHPGQQAHGMFSITQPDWGIWNRDTKTTLTMNSAQALGILRQAIPRGQAMSLNFNMYEDGSVTPETLQFFRQVKAGVAIGPPVSEGKPATVSGQWAAAYGAAQAVDGERGTFWSLAKDDKVGWLEVDLGQRLAVSRVRIQEVCDAPRVPLVTKFAVEALQADGTWKAVLQGDGIGAEKELTFAAVTAQKFRLHLLDAKDAGGSAPVIGEFQLFAK